ncbi:DUF6083 domain-containing protein [Streptomyces sp. NPDC004237]|uniref:DUF6083 domain-containing protein n=1 Tax=Streptomyces sp. NPDC004237 TaxID=3154455 RepID=UPI0033BBCF68
MQPSSAARHGDSSPALAYPRRSLRIDPDSPTRLLRCAQRGRCRDCGNHVEWYHRVRDRPVRLHPHELSAAEVPVEHRWHVSSGLAHPAGDGSAWCRLDHALVCPTGDASTLLVPTLTRLRRALAVNSRRLTDAGVFTLAASKDRSVQRPEDSCRPARPVVQLLYVRYLADGPLDEIRCVAQTRQRDRCTYTVLAPDGPAGVWRLVPVATTQGQLALPTEAMAVYDLSSLPYAEQLRWRTQRCRSHAAATNAADLALTDWEPFDPLLHHAHVHPRLPTHGRRPRPSDDTRKGARP